MSLPKVWRDHSKQLEVVQFVAVLHDIALNLAADGPGNEILQLASNEEGGIRDRFRTHADMALFNHLCRSLLLTESVGALLSVFFQIRRVVADRIPKRTMVSAIRSRVITTGRRRLANADTVAPCSTPLNLDVEERMPMS